MTVNPTPVLLDNLYWITLIAVIVSSASGVLKAGFKQFDLFGVIIIAIATGLGGGSLRDMLLDRDVFWIQDQVFFIDSQFFKPWKNFNEYKYQNQDPNYKLYHLNRNSPAQQ